MTDSLEHIGGSGLLLQRLAQFMEQARVFDGDYALSGETLQQFNLPVGERMNLLAVQRNRANQFAFSQHRHAQDRPHAAAFDSHDRERIAVEIGLRSGIIVELHSGAGFDDLSDKRIRTGTIQSATHVVETGSAGAAMRHQFHTGAMDLEHQAKIGNTQTQCVAEKHLKDRLQFAGRT